ncbi:formin-binding protein [Rhodotorula toruloides]
MQRPSSRARTRSTSSLEGAYHPPTDTAPDAFDYCNAFWVDPHKSREGGRRAEGDAEEKDWGKEGYETVMGRVKASAKVCDDLRALLKERASAAEDYAKRLNKLSRHSFGVGETGHMERAMLQVKSELEASAKSHTDLATLMRHQEATVADFVQKREAARKSQQTNLEKLWKNLLNTRQHVLKAKAKYQDDAIQINALHAQASLLQGRDLDKASASATLKLDKAQQTVVVNERDYRNYVNVLKETTVNWNMAWKSFCDLVQDQEEERLEFLKSRMWDYANGLSTLAMAEDESAERTRTALEQCDPKIDIRIFVQQFGTGNAIPDPIPFVDVSAKTAPPKQSYRSAAFTRSSTRIPGVTHSPSAIDDIARAMHHPPPSQQQRQQPQTSSQMPRSSTQPELESQSRPASRAANRMSQPNLSTQQTPAPATAQHLASPARPGQPPQVAGASPSRFAVSPSANLHQRPSSEHVPIASPPTSKPGHIPASAFQGRQSAVSPSLGASVNGASPATVDAGSSPAPARYEASAPAAKKAAGAPSAEDDENDPLLQALKQLQTTPVQAPARSQRSSVDLRGSAASPSQRPPSRGHLNQPSFGSAAGLSNGMMQPPPDQSQQHRPRSPSIPYVQSNPPRPSSRAGSNVSSAAGANPNRQSTGPHLASPAPAGQFAARPASPAQGQRYSARPTSPQPHIPDSLRPRSPAMGNPPSVASPVASVQSPARPLSAFGTPLSQGGYASPQQAPPPQQHFAAPPPQQPAAYAQPPQQGAYGGYRAPSPAPRPPSVVSPATGYAPHPQQQPHMAQAPSQQFQQYAQAPPPQPAYAPPPQQVASPPNSYAYPGQQQYAPPPQQQQQPLQHQQQYVRPPSVVGGYASPASAAQQAALARTPSTHSGVSGVSIQQTPLQAYQQPPVQQQQPQQQQHARGASVASMRAGQTPPLPPTGQYTESGQPILFYVNALFDYQAASAEEFSFSTGDVIAVTGTDPDGWWSGNRVGDQGPSKLFPSNFTEVSGARDVELANILNETVPDLATTSCEVCVLNPSNPLCEYGLDNIRMSRAYEGSGARLRRVLKRALKGEEIGVGVIGASVTAGHSVPPGYQRWQERFFDDFKKMFPNAKLHVGAMGATDSKFFSYCFGSLLPDDLDIYLVELDINDEPDLETLRDADALMRGLLQLPQEPAVIRVSVFQVIFEELARGVIANLVTSQYFDVPIIGIRNFLLPHVQHHREDAEILFGLDQWGNRDYRHISEVSHIAMADMLSLFMRKEVCEARRRDIMPKVTFKKQGPWPSGEDLGKIPPLQVFSSWRNPAPLDPVKPKCQTMYSKPPLTPFSHTADFERIEWHGKSAWASSTPGGQIRFSFHGKQVGVFVWATNGKSNPEEKSDDPEVRKREAPGQAKCWVEDVDGSKEDGLTVTSHWTFKTAPSSEFVNVAEKLPFGEHVLACEVLPTTTSGGHKFRLQGLTSL